MKPPLLQVCGNTHGDLTQFVLIVDDFGIEYVGKQYAQHLQKFLEDHYTLTMDWEGFFFQEQTSTGTTTPTTPSARVDCQWTAK